MTTQAGGLGRVVDFSVCVAPVDSQTASMTGKRFAMENCGGVMIVIFQAAGTAGDDAVYTLYEHNAYTSGDSAALAIITKYHEKEETALDGDEAWVEKTQSVLSTITDGTIAENQLIQVIDVRADALSAGYTHISLDIADTGSAATQPIAALYVPYDLKVQRTPANMPNWLNPGAANA